MFGKANTKRVSRLVILPDYQGIGLGTKFLNVIAKLYRDQGYSFSIITSAKNMIIALKKSSLWIATRYSKCTPFGDKKRTKARLVKTATFEYR